MRDFTQGPIAHHIAGMAGFVAISLAVQSMYLLVDLFFVAQLGKQALAGVAATGVVLWVVIAASQMIAVGALSLVSKAIGAKDLAGAQVVLEQSLTMAICAAVVTLVLGFTVGMAGVSSLTADEPSGTAARQYLATFLPALALTFPNSLLAAVLRAKGMFGPPAAIQTATVVLNIVLSPTLISGLGSGYPLGVAGAGLASSIAAFAGFIALFALFSRLGRPLHIEASGYDFRVWRRIAAIGLPATGEFIITFVILAFIYWTIRPFGAEAQAAFGIGSQVMQAIFLPALAIGYAIAPIVGQNSGAGLHHRVVATFRSGILICCAIMIGLTFVCQMLPRLFVEPFASNQEVLAIASEYMLIISWNFVGAGIVLTCSAIFQGLGCTGFALTSSASRLLTFILPVSILAASGGASLADIWMLSNASIFLQALLSLSLLKRAFTEMRVSAAPGLSTHS